MDFDRLARRLVEVVTGSLPRPVRIALVAILVAFMVTGFVRSV